MAIDERIIEGGIGGDILTQEDESGDGNTQEYIIKNYNYTPNSTSIAKALDRTCYTSEDLDNSVSVTLDEKLFNGYTNKIFKAGPHTITNNIGTTYTNVQWGQNTIPGYCFQDTPFLADKTKTPLPIRPVTNSRTSVNTWTSASGRVYRGSTMSAVKLSFSKDKNELTIINDTDGTTLYTLTCYGEMILDIQAAGGNGAAGTSVTAGITPTTNTSSRSGGGGGSGGFLSVYINFNVDGAPQYYRLVLNTDTNNTYSFIDLKATNMATSLFAVSSGRHADGITPGDGGTTNLHPLVYTEEYHKYLTPLIMLNGVKGGEGCKYYKGDFIDHYGNWQTGSAMIEVAKALPAGVLGTINHTTCGRPATNGRIGSSDVILPGGGFGGPSFMSAGGEGQDANTEYDTAGNGGFGAGGGGGAVYVGEGFDNLANVTNPGTGGDWCFVVYT